jgi:hypothetical protein
LSSIDTNFRLWLVHTAFQTQFVNRYQMRIPYAPISQGIAQGADFLSINYRIVDAVRRGVGFLTIYLLWRLLEMRSEVDGLLVLLLSAR